ncbi:MAG: hypothetical protein ACERLG_10360 [Sedimentibacter sp.]
MQSKIYELLDNCYECKSEEIPNIEFQLFLITVKSLLPYEDNIGCMFDISRYEKEIELLELYKNGNDDTIEFYINNKKPSEIDDKLLEYKIIPIAIANTIWENLIVEIMKIVFFYTINVKTILNAIILSSVIFEYFSSDEVDFENINIETKERIIKFSIKDYFENNHIEFKKNYYIEFERERIKILTNEELISKDIVMNYKALKHMLLNETTKEKQDNEIILNYSIYLLKLRKGTINPEKLQMKKGKIPGIKEFLNYPVFIHPLLGKCKIIKQTEKEVILRNKSGLMKVKI